MNHQSMNHSLWQSIGMLVVMLSFPSSVRSAERVVTLANGTTLTFVEIPAGRFVMGSPDGEAGRAADEEPRRDVTISRPFWLGKYELTQAQWRAVMGNNPSTFQDFAASHAHPVEGVSWKDAQEFLAKLNSRGVGQFRLPTEAEWEYAARAGQPTRFPWGDDPNYRELPEYAWFHSRAEGRSHPVGRKRANPWGLHDMNGGVWEWCQDWFGSYPTGPAVDPTGPADGKDRCIRGGSWFNEPEALRSANRHRHPPDSRQTNLGLRLVWQPSVGPHEIAVERRADGRLPDGYRVSSSASTGPWFVPVAKHVPIAAGEHPRLLFRRSDLPELRRKAGTPEGQAILKRLRFLLDGQQGETMTKHVNPARSGLEKSPPVIPDGTLTIGHASGYGLLYQLTGEQKYADFGRLCFERALEGVRDRDSRYSFRRPQGALRGGPSLGWMAVGYDLCYNGWDQSTRERFGRALLDYREEMPGIAEAKKVVDLESLARGTMPPHSNHFGMQTGGATLALLAVNREKWADQSRIDRLLEIAEDSLIRNLDEGFGDGGFFAEGDGTGSMASQIIYLTALQSWKCAAGRDFFASPRPHARMLTRKWMYQTVFHDGQPDFWPVRGGYPNNVWSRSGMSGAGYFAVGFGGLPPDERSAMKWIYNRFLAKADADRQMPFDTASVYPQYAVSAFVHWPLDQPEIQPGEVLPHAYRDSVTGFFCWRDRWRDENDTVITVLTSEVRGYMGAKADKALAINRGRRHSTWGLVGEGPIRRWSASPRAETSSLTMADGTSVGVDFTGTSGSDIMLVTTGTATGQAVSLPQGTLTFYFPREDKPPQVRMEDGVAVVGRQRVSMRDGHLHFGLTGR